VDSRERDSPLWGRLPYLSKDAYSRGKTSIKANNRFKEGGQGEKVAVAGSQPSSKGVLLRIPLLCGKGETLYKDKRKRDAVPADGYEQLKSRDNNYGG